MKRLEGAQRVLLKGPRLMLDGAEVPLPSSLAEGAPFPFLLDLLPPTWAVPGHFFLGCSLSVAQIGQMHPCWTCLGRGAELGR